MSSTQFNGSAKRPVRIANCSGADGDPGYQMLRQATQGPVDFITGDYLAEVNLASNAEAYAAGKHVGYSSTALDGITQSATVLAERGIRVILNGGALDPEALAKKVVEVLKEKRIINLSVAWVSGDNLLAGVKDRLEKHGELPLHLDSNNKSVVLPKNARDLLKPQHAVIAANAYLGARGIVKALENGADIVICGRVADASPVVGAAWWWHHWKDTDYDALAGALIGGHLIECSAYVTGSNFSGFDEYPLEDLIDLPFGICEIAHDGSSVVTKHEGTKGFVNADNVKTQLLYELQGDIYLNSDVKAYIKDVRVENVGKDRVHIWGTKGAPPPPTTKLAVFYRGGFESQLLFNAAGYAVEHKFALWKQQLEFGLKKNGVLDQLDMCEFQFIGRPEKNASSQFAATSYFRLLAQGAEQSVLLKILSCFGEFGMQHFSGMHCSVDFRTGMPRPFLAYWPSIVEQDDVAEKAHILNADGNETDSIDAGRPSEYEALEPRPNFETSGPIDIKSLGFTKTVRLGDVALGRSGDKGANINFGVFVRDASAWDWFRTYMTSAKLQELVGDDWKDDYYLERVEFPYLYAVHFVVYGILGRGVSSATNLDILGKGFADYIRNREIEVPESILQKIGSKPTLPLESFK